MRVVTFRDFVPPPRYDGKAWYTARIEEGLSSGGPWTLLEVKALSPIDTDPASPAPRNFTTEVATLDAGWYRITFVDQTGDEMQPVTPVQNVIDTYAFAPTNSEVAALLRARTINTAGTELGTFTANTRPTVTEVQYLIGESVRHLAMTIGSLALPSWMIGPARKMAALMTAMLIELSYFPEQVGTNRSPYAQYKELYDSLLLEFKAAIEVAEAEVVGTVGEPKWFFPVPQRGLDVTREGDPVAPGLVGWDTVM